MFCDSHLPPPQLTVETTKLYLFFYSQYTDGNRKGFQIRYQIQSNEDDDTGMYHCVLLLIVCYLTGIHLTARVCYNSYVTME